MVKKIIGVVIILIAACAVFLHNNDFLFGTKIVRIGSITPQSGEHSEWGRAVTKVLDYHLTRINEVAAKKGYSFVLSHKDGGCNEMSAQSAYQDLKNHGIRYIVGGTCYPETLTIAKYSGEDHILTISPSSSHPAIEGASPYTYTLSYQDNSILSTLTREMGKFENIAIITADTPRNTYIRDAFIEAITQYPVVVTNETFSGDSIDYSTLLKKVLDTEPDAIFLNPNDEITATKLVQTLEKISSQTNYTLYGIGQIYRLSAVSQSALSAIEGMIVIDFPSAAHSNFSTTYAAIESEQGSLQPLELYHAAATLDALDLLTTLIMQEDDDVDLVQQALVGGTHTGYIGTIDLTSTSFTANTGAGKYVVEDGTAVFKENL